MSPTRVLVVEDENVIAMDLRTRLTHLGYVVPAVAASGAAALQKIEELGPDAVLMDIVLKGDMDGVQAAEQIRERFGLPVIYLTAHSDENTLQRARITEPFGYILKPFEDRELLTTIEMALYRHHIEKQLRESEARFRSLVEHSHEVIMILDADRVIRYCSPSTTQVLGYLPEAMAGKSLFEFVSPEKAPLVVETLQRLRCQPGMAISSECCVRHSDGSWRTMIGHLTNLLDDPAIKGIVINYHDITERKRAEEALQESQDRYRTLIETSPDAIFLTDLNGRFITLNQQAAKLHGFDSSAEMLTSGLTVFDLIAKLEPRQAGEVFQSILAEGSLRDIESLAHRRDGTTFPIEISASAVLDAKGRPYAVMGISRDITERKQAEKALQQHNRDLAQLYSVSQTLASTLDPHQVAERLMTVLKENIRAEGGSIWLLESQETGVLVCQLACPDPPRSMIGLRLKAGEGIAGWVAQTGQSAVVPDVSVDPQFAPTVDALTGFRTFSVLAVPLRIQDQVIGVLEAINKSNGGFDAHDRVLLEMLSTSASIAIDNARLVEALRRRTVELQTRNEELDAFSHTAAHDLKSPLGVMVGFAETLENHVAGLDAEQQRALQNIAQSGRKMDNIIEEMLLLAGVRKKDVKLQSLDMATIVAEAQRRLVDMIKQYQAEIIVERPAEWPPALGYAPWVEEVWVNYLSNAIQYGGQPPRIELGAMEQPGGFVRFWVRDNGPGLSREEQARLFTPFTQLDQVRARGHGLGLSIVQRILEKLEGRVGVESENVPGHGATFYFDLPDLTH